ncbi:---NA--- [Octopus vulgaris]|uniref:---NA n=1 Tax=Octopus vulgaris TaxID=6645 RepID=A0AA36F4C1_OCTVU|nr:---NA--- [Octopus vulgaris]
MWLMATTEGIERIPYQIEVENEPTINIEEMRPNCYLCGTRGHIRRECPLYEFTQSKETEKEQKKEQRQEKEGKKLGKSSTLKEKENKEREKPKEENKGATSPKSRKTSKKREHSVENTGSNFMFKFYGAFVIFRSSYEIKIKVWRMKGVTWIRLGTKYDEDDIGALVHEDSYANFIEVAKKNIIEDKRCRLMDHPHLVMDEELKRKIDYLRNL